MAHLNTATSLVCSRCSAAIPAVDTLLAANNDVLCPDCATRAPSTPSIDSAARALVQAAEYMESVSGLLTYRSGHESAGVGLRRHAAEIRKHTAAIIASIRADAARAF